jgi:hypothetical protein
LPGPFRWARLLKKSRWLLLKHEGNLKTEQRFRLLQLAHTGRKFLDDWCRQVMRSRTAPMKSIARSHVSTAN